MALLEIKGLTQRFGGLQAVSDFNIELEAGELAGLIGPNGAGKTTVFNLTSGFYTPTEGSITFDGTPTRGLRPHQVTALGIARTFQNIRLWHDLSVLDNIRIAQHHRLGYTLWDAFLRTRRYTAGEKAIDAIAWEMLEAMDLKEYANEVPRNLPYGMQRRVEIARAMSMKPKLLLLDEPAAGLNSVDVDGLIRLIRWIHDEFDITIWMIEHQMKVVMSLCQRIKVIDFGSTIADGTPETIQTNPVVIKAYLGDDTI
ncbi:ABC transporter ATP-binding protein [Nitratidesulfovibrio vulgaris]|jgi:branched-chain amino acid transport system ATP-binding protein|uniref:High-affinity branched chain amino acid ABC transporter, ATP-binding protein n=2 Tax=Nitratidesulfovibrio vulgaris TaxID=881 RepID=Q727W3_NITV2|nr:ABC transporter ATP-binding protein [Nitratidesulfovibrio vulgaris]GEB79655.1 ABC transporter ATP-binding protein [Desulfovibrio desulfuricans]HBW16210.1 ABC transporter ATP-binding protein [Desulfovibrio sp.]AAS97213.1 high-affinity branched chain amino acid ABC transporter, ATP-binding protein [Nitratidesulfovibrio vulgaris str. Hildenborough]ABM27588.1 amino acid/amide ABC transporter ATP-binding protein 1, HAAT family [Nitratidesulfovibrio vulgaris DP4]ADP87675.1 ABC transporter related